MPDEDLKQKLSLLVDERLDTAAAMRLMKTIESDREHASTYERYLLIGESLRMNGRVIHDAGFVDRVHRALDNEPRLLAPVWKTVVRDRAVTLALAATLAGLAVLVGESVMRQSELSAPGVAQQAQNDGAAVKPNDVDTYLVNHSGTAYLAANGGLLPYLRVVSQGKSSR